ILAFGAVFTGLEGQALLDALARFALMGLGYALYLGATIFVVLAVSALCRRSRTALFLLLALWIGTVLIAPRTIADIATKAYPSPSRLGFDAALSEDLGNASSKVWT